MEVATLLPMARYTVSHLPVLLTLNFEACEEQSILFKPSFHNYSNWSFSSWKDSVCALNSRWGGCRSPPPALSHGKDQLARGPQQLHRPQGGHPGDPASPPSVFTRATHVPLQTCSVLLCVWHGARPGRVCQE